MNQAASGVTDINYINMNLIMSSDTPSIRSRGRPKGGRNIHRARLLAAAGDLIGTGPQQSLSLRQIAQQAGVTPALANYYFGTLEGLTQALVVERISPHVDDLVAAARVRAGQPQLALTFLMQRTCSLLASEPLVRRCLWLQLPAALKLRNELRICLRELLVRAQDMQALRADLSPDYLTDSLLGLTLFPFFDDTRESDAGSERITRLTLQHVALLRDGIVRAQKPNRDTSG